MKILNTLLISLLAYSASAQVGIGTSTPTVPLDIEAADAAIDINNTSTDPLIHFILSDVTKFTIGVDLTDSKFKIGTTALETGTAVTVQPTGEVGIGTTSPTALLHVKGNANVWSGFRLETTATGFETGLNITPGYNMDSQADEAVTFDIDGVDAAERFVFSSGATFNGSNGTEHDFKVHGTSYNALFVDASANNVGIGTATPLAPLHVIASSATANLHERGIANFFYNHSQAGGGITAYKARGTTALPTTIINGDYLGGITLGGYDGANYLGTSGIFARANGTIAAGSIPTDIVFITGSVNNAATEKMRITSAGRVGINHAAPTRTLFVNGDAGGTSAWFNDSDERLKKNIETIEYPIEKLLALRGVNFEWKDTTHHDTGLQMGFIAQEAEKVIPEVVDAPKTDSTFYSMQYAPITALLVEAVKKQQAIIESQKQEIETIKAEASSSSVETNQKLKETAQKLAALEAKLNALLLQNSKGAVVTAEN